MPFDGLDFSCPDWEEKISRGETPLPDIPLHKETAYNAAGLFDSLRLPDVAGQPTLGEAGGKWARDIVEVTFGAVDPETKHRLFRDLFLLVPKKNSKTTNSAAFGIVWLCLNTTPNVRGAIVGPTQKVAETCFDQAMNMIALDPDLRDLLQVQEHKKSITHRITGAKLEIKTFDASVVTGSIPVFVILDELHIMSLYHNAAKIIRQLRGGMNKPICLLIIITTQSMDPPAGVFKSDLQYARGVRDGLITEGVQMLPVLYEFPEYIQTSKEDLWRDKEIWRMVLPNLGRSVFLDLLYADYLASRDKGKEEEILWASQHLNIEVGLGLHSDRWRGADYWLNASEDRLTLQEVLRRSEVITVGADGGGLDDLFGLAVCGRCRETRDWLMWFRAWCHNDVLANRKQIAEQLRDFAVEETLTIIDDDQPNQDFEEVADIIVEINESGLLAKENAVGLDPFGISDLVDLLLESGLAEEQLAAVAQGVKLSSAVWGMERKLKNRRLIHDGSDLMTWVVGNAKSEQRGNAIYISKQAAGKAKIDPLIAGFNAAYLMALNPEAAGPGLDEFLNNPVMVV